MIDPKNDLFKWGPIDGKPCYIMTFVDSFVHYYKFIGTSWPDVIIYYENDKVIGICDYEDLRDAGQFLFENNVLKEPVLKKAWKSWEKARDDVLETEKMVNKGLSKYSDKELKEMVRKWHKVMDRYWLESFLPELANWGGERILKQRIEAMKSLDKKDYVEILEKLSAPEDFSFYQQEELDLMKSRLSKDTEKSLEEHQKKYYWINNSYGQTEVKDVDFFRKKLEKVSEEYARKKTEEIENFIKKSKQEKENVIKKFNIDQETAKIAHKLAYCIWWQDLRKSYVFIGLHITTEFWKEISKRTGVSFEELTYYSLDDQDKFEVEKLLETGKPIDLTERKKAYFVHYHTKEGIETHEGKAAKKIIKPYLEVEVDEKTEEFSGMVVSKGKESVVRGKAKIVHTPKEIGHMEDGDILVAPMTSPDFIVAIRKASAIVTDEGGMTCHAAIVSRELGIPCIVKTRIATKLLKDGDLIEVNANHGQVKIIDRKK